MREGTITPHYPTPPQPDSIADTFTSSLVFDSTIPNPWTTASWMSQHLGLPVTHSHTRTAFTTSIHCSLYTLQIHPLPSFHITVITWISPSLIILFSLQLSFYTVAILCVVLSIRFINSSSEALPATSFHITVITWIPPSLIIYCHFSCLYTHIAILCVLLSIHFIICFLLLYHFELFGMACDLWPLCQNFYISRCQWDAWHRWILDFGVLKFQP